MYKVHQDAQYLPVNFVSPDYTVDGKSVPAINLSASKDKDGVTHISLVNIDPKFLSCQYFFTGYQW